MRLLLLSLTVLVGGGVLSACLARRRRLSTVVGAGAALVGSGVGLIGTVPPLLAGNTLSFFIPWSIPGGAVRLGLDPLSGFFLIPVFLVGGMAALYGASYLKGQEASDQGGASWFHYNLLVASMVTVLMARNAVVFLIAWETMALASFLLVTLENRRAEVRSAGWIYMVATHLGTAFLLALFAFLGQKAGSLDFTTLGRTGSMLPSTGVSVAFVLAVVGFGAKAGFLPLHVWLPEAHPAAPSHVSALMSGVMIKTGIYGLLRSLTWLGTPPSWWGWLLVGIGFTSGILGVLFALAQHDLKRLLAYHSVENIGIIALGVGLGLVGQSAGSAALAALGFGGALLHVLNHALFKGLLFLGAGAVLHATGTRNMDHLGGLIRRMPWTATTFLVGAVAICGLPPLNGFVSEFLIYLGAIRGVTDGGPAVVVVSLGVIVGLALIGGLAVACFTKAFGVVFLGEPRSNHAARGHEVAMAMRVPMVLLALSCAAVGLLAPLVVRALKPTVNILVMVPSSTGGGLDSAAGPARWIVIGSVVFLGMVAVLAIVRSRLVNRYPVGRTVTWDCGYARPTARMQYTSSSYAQPLTYLFRMFLRTRRRSLPPEGVFPSESSLATETPDVFQGGLYQPLFERIAGGFSRLQRLQQGRVQLYVLYIAITLIGLLVLSLG